MTSWDVYHGDIFDVSADVLVCSANVFLTLSGGVGGELLKRYGLAMQTRLVEYISIQQQRYVPRGTVVTVSGKGTPYKVILHAVAVDGMYDSTPEVIKDTIINILDQAAAHGGRSIAIPALATGYGHLKMSDFLEGYRHVVGHHPAIDRVTLALRDCQDTKIAYEAISRAFRR